VDAVAPLSGMTILDAGCGDGQYIDELKRYTGAVQGVEIEPVRASHARQMTGCRIDSCDLSQLLFADRSFDLVFCNEVLEHTDDDVSVLKEFHRVLKADGRLALYVPNRWFPLETHGGRIFGIEVAQFPFLNYLPLTVRNRICKAARIYTRRSIKAALGRAGMRAVHVSYIYPSFDRSERTHPGIAKVMRSLAAALEKSPFRMFGISLFVLAAKE
jgi:SAM-dependent methyltransferase